ncbi:MAG: type II toxin-antitoxin system HicB family antitoxin [Gammaproteobacteria bacterium]|nr:type II toxin-antitoxin system HicB family antitoxin [Gammaproteobacteria bacterium]
MKYSYPVILTEDTEDGGYVVTCRDLPEAITQGDMVAEALAEAADAPDEALCGRINHGRDIPEPSAEQAGELLVSVLVSMI